jgi:hypothetical protein
VGEKRMSEAMKAIKQRFDEWSRQTGLGIVFFLNDKGQLDGYYYDKKTNKKTDPKKTTAY